jgi:hypothetical protein
VNYLSLEARGCVRWNAEPRLAEPDRSRQQRGLVFDRLQPYRIGLWIGLQEFVDLSSLSGVRPCNHGLGTRHEQRPARENLKEQRPPGEAWRSSSRKRCTRTGQPFRTTWSGALILAFQALRPTKASPGRCHSRSNRSGRQRRVRNDSKVQPFAHKVLTL